MGYVEQLGTFVPIEVRSAYCGVADCSPRRRNAAPAGVSMVLLTCQQAGNRQLTTPVHCPICAGATGGRGRAVCGGGRQACRVRRGEAGPPVEPGSFTSMHCSTLWQMHAGCSSEDGGLGAFGNITSVSTPSQVITVSFSPAQVVVELAPFFGGHIIGAHQTC